MSIISIHFLLFALVLFILYYLLPKRFQWILLLIFSLAFYALSGLSRLPYILITATTVWGAACLIQRNTGRQKDYLAQHKADLSKEQKSAYKAKQKSRRKRILVLTLVLNFGILCAFKYVHFLLAQADHVVRLFGGEVKDTVDWIIPLGISFYTFQSVGYLLDVFWGKCEAQRNWCKVLLFTSFFPQITQGPISAYGDLSKELFAGHELDYRGFSWGAQRMMWGFFKKMVVANILSSYVGRVFQDFPTYTGVAAFMGALCYSAQIYADFSGYMDIMCGFCQMLGIKLTENFERPYFSKSIAEYWRRWHMSLGVWFKNYVYYPIAISKWNQKLGKNAKAKLGKAFGNYLPATVALVVTWLATGLWHGASWGYIAWGGLNGLFIIVSMWMEKPFERWKKALRINENAWLWRAFQTRRTFLLVTFIKVLPEVNGLRNGLRLWKRIFTEHSIPHRGVELLPFLDNYPNFFAVVFGILLMFFVSMIQRKRPFRAWLEQKTVYPVRMLIFVILFFAIIYFGVPASGGIGGFMYAQF